MPARPSYPSHVFPNGEAALSLPQPEHDLIFKLGLYTLANAISPSLRLNKARAGQNPDAAQPESPAASQTSTQATSPLKELPAVAQL